jgi:hypothetical protein
MQGDLSHDAPTPQVPSRHVKATRGIHTTRSLAPLGPETTHGLHHQGLHLQDQAAFAVGENGPGTIYKPSGTSQAVNHGLRQ